MKQIMITALVLAVMVVGLGTGVCVAGDEAQRVLVPKDNILPVELVIAELLLSQQAAARRGDLDGLMAIYADGAEVDSVSMGRMVKDQLIGELRGIFVAMEDFQVFDLKVYLRGEKEALAIYKKSFSTQGGFSSATYLSALEKKNGSWVIAWEHIVGFN